jgi:hypothetical protein
MQLISRKMFHAKRQNISRKETKKAKMQRSLQLQKFTKCRNRVAFEDFTIHYSPLTIHPFPFRRTLYPLRRIVSVIPDFHGLSI